MGGFAGAGSLELRFDPVQRGQAVAVVFISDVVDESGEPVDGQEMGAVSRGDCLQRDREVLASPLVHDRVQVEPDFSLHSTPAAFGANPLVSGLAKPSMTMF